MYVCDLLAGVYEICIVTSPDRTKLHAIVYYFEDAVYLAALHVIHIHTFNAAGNDIIICLFLLHSVKVAAEQVLQEKKFSQALRLFEFSRVSHVCIIHKTISW